MGRLRRVISRAKRLLNYNFDKSIEELSMQNMNLLRKINELESIINNHNNDSNYINNLIYNNTIDIRKNFKYTSLETVSLTNRLNSNKKQLLICGFYGAFNLGDELMLNKLLESLKNKSDYEITIMLCDNESTDITKYGPYKFIHYPSCTCDLNNIALYYDAVIFGGGAIIDDYKYDEINSQMSLGYILVNLAMRFITFGKKTILYALSTNTELSNKEFVSKLNFVIQNCDYFSLRDSNSLDVLKLCDIDTSRVKIVNDIVFSYDFSGIEKTKGNVVNVGIIYYNLFDENENLVEYTKNIIKYFKINSIKYKINFISFYNYLNSETQLYYEIKDKLNDSNINIIEYQYDFDSIKRVLENQNYIISMRYHASLIANMLRKPVLTLIYSHRHYKNKMNYLYDNYGFFKRLVNSINNKNLKEFFESKDSNDGVNRKYISQAAEKDIKNMMKKL